jgi:hypothetical protein
MPGSHFADDAHLSSRMDNLNINEKLSTYELAFVMTF